MQRSSRSIRTVRSQSALAAFFAVAVVILVLYKTGGYVAAYRETKSAHIFPTAVIAEGWNNGDAALAQELGASAPYESFSISNSAYLTIGAHSPAEHTPQGNSGAETLTNPGEERATTTPATGDEIPVEELLPENVPVESPTETPTEAPTETPTETPTEAPVETPMSPDAPEQVVPAEPAAPSVETSVSGVFEKFVHALIPTVYATTSDSVVDQDQVLDTTTPETTAITEDVPTCFLQQKECHTITLTGFSVSGEITETNFQKATLNFSFAANIGETELIDDKLEVRYYHEGKWREVGEIYLNKQFSNASNGGYYTATLDDIEAWEEFSDIKIVIEYDRNNDAAVDLYLDAVWIDSEYRELLADVVSGEDDEPTLPDNVVLELNEGGAVGALVLSDGSHITFPYTDDLDDSLVIRTDKSSYGHTGETIYASLTNTSGVADSIRLHTAFSRGFGSVLSIEELKKNVPTTTETPQYQEVTYFCDAGWATQSASTTPASASGYVCESTQEMRACSSLNSDNTNCSVAEVLVGSESSVSYTSGWVPLPVSDAQDSQTSIESYLPPLYRVVSKSDERIDILPGQTVYIRLMLESTESDALQFALFAQGAVISGDLNGELLKEERVLSGEDSATLTARKKGNSRMFGKAEFDGDELPQFKFQFKSKRNFVSRGLNALLGRGNEFAVEEVTFLRSDDTRVTLPVAVEYGVDGQWTLEIKTHPRSFRPGKYSAEITMREGNDVFTERVDFYWGLLAMNINQSSYVPGEVVPIAMAALDDLGNTICDADLRLNVTDPAGISADVPVGQSGLCGDNNVIDVADYLATFTAGPIGRYTLALTEYDDENRVIHRVFDAFDVVESAPFVIRRAGMTRIYPVAAYSMDIELTSTNGFIGEFVESVPADFEILEYDGAEVRMYGGAKNLVWQVVLEPGETKRVSYTYDAPDLSPYMFLLGPAQVQDGDGIPFEEPRQWKIASDAVGNMLLYWDQAWIPTGWSCVSCLPADSFYQRFIMGSSTAGLNGGSATQTHTATGVVNATDAIGVSSTGVGGADAAQLAHTHAYTPTIGSTSTLPRYRHLAVIQYNSAGEPPSIPAGAIAVFDAAVPSGWTQYSAQDGYFVRSESTSTVSTTGGTDYHYHALTGTTGASLTNTNAPGTTGVSTAADTHTHTVSSSTSLVSTAPPYIEVILGKLTATTTPPIDMIAMWSGDPPAGWDTVSSSSEPMSDRFLKPATAYGPTGGSASHSHTDISGITSSAPSAAVTRSADAANADASGAHTHAVDVTGFSTTDGRPPFRTAVIAKRTGVTPYVPDLYGVLFDNEKTGTSTPSMEFSAYDPVGADSIVYQIQWDDDADLDTSPLGDRTSDAEAGCSPNCFSNVPTPADTSPFNEGEKVRFTIQTPLVSGTTYHWRVRAKTPTTSYGDWATTTSFTYVGGIAPSQWQQTTDAQFDLNTLSGVSTYGSNSARLTLTAEREAMIAYGEGIVQTPRYRLWNGSSWSAESSAQDVGGIVQWVAVKGGTTRDEYVMGAQDANNDVNVQVYNGGTDTWGNLQEVTISVASNARRGFDIAYETTSGDALAVYCDGDADPSFYVWNGTTWTSGGTINLTSVNNCEYIKLASDPLSDEIIVVSRDTGASYEAQVWSGSAWGNARTIGSMVDLDHEGIALEYEASGDQAIVTVSNGGAASFAWTSWNGVEWGINTTQALGDDFEWGTLRADVGTDNMALCYMDQDADIGVVRWDGNAWVTFSERELAGNANTGRAVDCAFETTTGRDGYIMATYSDTTNARYQYWNGTTWAAEQSITTIQDATTVETIRTGDGSILSVFNDDVNTQFDFSYWNGSSWSTIDTLETSPSVAVTPFLQPFAMTQKVYQSSSGTMTSQVIDFDSVPSRMTWGEVLFRTTEPIGTNVKVQVLYESAGVCTTLVPDITLPGNSTGFDATSSPVNISALSTSTYNRICVRATLSTTNLNAPTLDEWTITWERQAYLTQTHFRWYANAASSLTPTDAWPSGGTDLSEDVAIPVANSPSPNDVLRLRMSVLAENVSLAAGDLALKLQYAVGSSCSASLAWQDVGAIGSTTAAWRGYNNAALSDGATLASNLIATGDARETYEEENDSALNPNTINANDEGEWDWAIQHNASSSVSYCFRAVTSGGEVLNEYDIYPALITNAPPLAPTQEQPFNNEVLASTTPWFEFVAEDPESDDITYQIQIDDDSAFGSVNIDRDSQNYIDEFTNLVTPSDKDPFTTAQSVRFIPTTALSNGTTYYWRVRGKDRARSAEWSSWSTVQSVTIDSLVTISTWRQTTLYQFSGDTHEETEATSTNDVILTPPSTTGTTSSTLIDFDWKRTGNAWGSLSFNDTETSSDVLYHIEYYNAPTDEWLLVPDTDLSGNAAGYDTSPVSLLSVSPTIYNQIRIRANLTNLGLTPHILDWQIAWGLAVEQPQMTALFDNEKTATITPTFTFMSDDPQGDDLVYEVSISTTQDFTASTTRRSNVHSGFTNTASSTDTTPFIENNLIQFTLQAADALTNGTTYWWRVRAIDTGGGNVWSVWSDLRSFTIDTTVGVSTWYQTTNEQWATDSLSNIQTSGGAAQITSTIREAFTAYAEGTVQVPRFRIWSGTEWGAEQSGISVGDTIRFVEVDSAPTRDEYIIATMGSTGVVDAQIVNGTTDIAGNATEIVATAPDTTQRGFDVAYETSSGDALAVACSGTEATYKVWNGSSWSASNAITLAVTVNCEWIKLVSDPTSDEIILVARDATTGATDYNALVWDGSSWGNSMTMGSQATVTNEGIAVEYEESGGQAIVVVSNGANNNFIWNSWNGSAWLGTATVATGNDFGSARLVRDVGSDAMNLCYVDIDTDIGYVRWDGSAWSVSTEFEATGNSNNSRPLSCEFETTAGRDGYIMIPYSDTVAAEYVYWNGSVLSTAALITTISDAAEIRTARTGDGLILAVAYDDANTEYDFAYWNGTSWSVEEVLEATSITTIVPPTIPLDIVARRYPAFTSGTVESSAIVFSTGSGPKWGSITFSKTTPGSSSVTIQLEYYTSTSSWALIPESGLPGNSVGTTTSPVDISNVNRITYSTIRMKASLACVAGNCPTLNDWTLTWAQGINVSGTVHAYDQSTNVTSGTVAVAINGVIQAGKTATISAGAFSIPNVTVFQDDIVTVFVDGAAEANEAVAVTKYDGLGDVAGLNLYEHHLSIGSDDNQTITNGNIAQYDNSISGDEDIFYDVDAGNDLSTCVVVSGSCSDIELIIKAATVYRPDSASSGNVATYGIENNGTITADGNSISVSGSWDNNATFNKDSSTVIFTATSSTQSVDSTGATLSTFQNVTFGTSGTATWTLASALDVDGSLVVNFGTLSPGSRAITVAGNLTFGASGVFAKGNATITFDGSSTGTWTDNTAAKQDLGTTTIDGTNKTVLLGSAAKATNVTIGADDTLSVNNNYALEVLGNWTNNNAFVAQSGTVTFSATTTGKTITPGSSSFYNLVFNGSGGNWSFTGPVTAGNDFTITTGTVTLPSATTTVTGSFSSSGTFQHNNGAILFNSTSAGKTVTPGSSSFYDLTFSGTGSWSFGSTNATSSRNTTITQGAVTLPSGTYAVGGSFIKTGGSFANNNGTLKLMATNAQTVQFSGSDAYNLTFSGTDGSWSFNDASATTTNTVRFENGTTTLPSGTFAVGGSWTNAGGPVTAGSGTVKFIATSMGRTISVGASSFANVIFDGVGGGWTISENATSTGALSITNATVFTVSNGVTLAVGGTFTNAIGGAPTTWSGSILSLTSGIAYSLNSKSAGGDIYGTLSIGANTDVRMWNSSSTVATVNSTGSLYSQDHAAVDGDLYIWGEFVSSSSEYWSYATDFDGVALGGSPRQVDVRIATSSSVSFSTGTFSIVGSVAATTTIQNQGTGLYSFAVSGGTLNAQYYQFKNTSAAGVAISGTTAITSLSNGDFELGVNGGTMLTVASTVVDTNAALQIQQVTFATSTGISSGSNVTETGTPSSYWWFRNHYGNYAGENFDVDPGGNPGFIRWDDSGFSITVSGNVYANEGSTAIGSPVCDGSTPSVRIVVNYGASSYTGSCDAGTGAYSIPGVSFTAGAVLTAYLNTNGGARAVTVTRTPTTDIINFDLYQNELIVRHEDTEAITIAQLAAYDSTDDSDIPMTAATGSPSTLTTAPGTELHIWTGKTFAPGGNVTLSGGGGSAIDARFHIATSSSFIAAGSESHEVGGSLGLQSGATLTAASSTFTFTATTTGRSIYAVQPFSLWSATFNGVGGGWSLSNGFATTTVQNTLALTAGTLSGTGDLIVTQGTLSGSGTVAMTGGTVQLVGTGSLGGATSWSFNNLLLGAGISNTTSKTGVGTTTITGSLTVSTGQTLNASSTNWVFTGGGTPFVVNGTFNAQLAPFFFTANTATTIADEDYAVLYLTPASAGTPVYTLRGGSLSASSIAVGGTNSVSVDVNSNDPTVTVSGNVTIGASSIVTASNVNVFNVGGSWNNAGSFVHSNGDVNFNSTDTGETINAGSSSFYNLSFASASGGWTITEHATSTNNFSLTNATLFTLSPNKMLAVGGTFTNGVGGSATTWATSTLSLYSGTSYSINTKSAGNDVYGTLLVGANTDLRMWNSSAETTSVNSTGSLYSQDHAAVDGDLYIWGDYVRSSGSEYWSYATDFDGTALGGSSRQVDVRIATSSSVLFTGGSLEILGVTLSTTTVANQGTGRYAFAVTGGSSTMQYYQIRNTDPNGLSLSGSPVINSLSDGDYELSVNGGTMMTVAGSVIDANPLKIFARNNFATSTGITSGYNVRATGSSVSSWKFNLHSGNFDGEAFNSDPAGDPGYIRWDDSASAISISGNVYSDEGTTVSAVCDNATQVVQIKIQGAGSYTSACNSSTGLYSVSGVAFNPGDTITVFLDTAGGQRAANVSIDPISSISNMHLYENRVIVRHEDVNPITIAQMSQYDSDQDADIPFNATDAATDTLALPPNTKLIVFNNKTFTPGGNVTLQSGGSGTAWDGTLEVFTGGVFTAGSGQSHSIGGSLLIDSGATLTSSTSTFTMTATTTGKTISLNNSNLYNITFNGVGGNWAFNGGTMTATNDFTISAGTVTMPTATSTIGGSFQNTGGIFMHNNGVVLLNSTATGKTVRVNANSFYSLEFNGAGGAWSFFDSAATSSNNFVVTNGTVTAPTVLLTVGGSFQNSGTFTSGVGTLKLISNTTGKSLRAGGSAIYNMVLDGVGGSWTFSDTNATVTRDFTILNGSTTLPTGTFTIGGSWATTGGTFSAGSGTVTLNATTTGKTVDAGLSSFNNLVFNSSAGGWTISQNATSTADTTITNANLFTLANGTTLAVGGTFTNGVGGAATTWATSTLSLYSGTSYSINTKSAGNDVYGTLLVGANTDVRMWNSTAATTTVSSTGSLYSQDNAGLSGVPVDGDLYMWGEYVRSSGSDYWSYATDFDGTALGGSSRQVNVKIATSSSVTLSGGSLDILGSTATTTIANQGTGRYAFTVSGGTLNASHYQIRNTDPNGLNLTGSPTITSLDYGDMQLEVTGGAMVTLAGSVIDANASKQINYISFATTTGISSGYNISRTGTPISAWTFLNHNGNYDGEVYDNDGGDSCGNVRWSDSACLFVNQGHYRWRADDGGIGAPNSEWYNASWSKRKKIAVANPTGSAMTNQVVKIIVDYDADMQTDFEDLRFTDSSGTTTIPYWIESSTASASSTVWVKLSTIPASGSTNVYMYYGNSGAIDGGNGTTAFKFFDDFEDNNITEYSGNTTLFQTGTTFNHNYLYGLDAGINANQKTTSGIYQTGTLVARGDTIRFFQYMSAAAEDEPCTLFAVQGSAQNYAVCLDQYPAEKVAVSKNVTSNDGSGTSIASTTVTFATGWYEVQVDWLTTNAINVTVYDSTGAVFATVNTSDSTYSSGGMGFSFWFQHAGWDFYSVRPYVSSAPTYVFGAEQVSGGASWYAAEDTVLVGLTPGDNVRLRLTVQNSGSPLTSETFRLQYATKAAALNCESVAYGNYSDVPTTAGGCGGAAACMMSSTQFTDQTAISDLLSRPASMSFTQGKIMEDPSNQTSALNVATNAATEVEYNFKMTGNAVDSAYCFRTSRAGSSLDNYDRVAEVVLAHAPLISNFALNLGFDIALTEGATTTVSATGTVTDLNGSDDIVAASSTMYRSSVGGGAQCSSNVNNCYVQPTCTLSNCSGNTCTVTCSAEVQYLADPTDIGSTYSADNWLVQLRIRDASGLYTTNTASPVDLLTMYGFTISSPNINFGALNLGENTGATTTLTTVVNTGNAAIDIQLLGTDLEGPGGPAGAIPVGQQKVATSTFTYASCSVCQALTGSASTFEVDLPKPTATSSAISDNLYWGINVPINTAAATLTGTNTFMATGD